jgi:hypothetical protein
MSPSRNTGGGSGRQQPACDTENGRSMDGLPQGRGRRPAQVAGLRGGVGSGGGRWRSAAARRQPHTLVAGDEGYVQRLEALVAALTRVNSGLEEQRRAMERRRAAERRRASGAAGGGSRAGGDCGTGDAGDVGPRAPEAGASAAFESCAGEERDVETGGAKGMEGDSGGVSTNDMRASSPDVEP